jgi:YD repeat-containing protein
MSKSRFACMLMSISISLLLHESGAQIVPANPIRTDVSAALTDCQNRARAEIFPAETCSLVVSLLGPGEKLGGGPFEDGSFLVVSTDADGKSIARIDNLPPRLRSEIALKSITATARNLGSVSQESYNALFSEGSTLWSRIRDIYCHYHPEEAYTDIAGQAMKCADQTPLPDDKIVQTTFAYAVVYKSSVLLATSVENSESKAPETNPPASVISAPTLCERNVSFAVAESGQIVPRVPGWVQSWIGKNQKKYPGLCFSQFPNPKSSNFLLVLSASQTAFNGLYPTVRTNTDTSTTPVSGRGTVTDNNGGMWNYTYSGTVTTRTTNATQQNLPYTDTSNTLYLYGYDSHGKLMSEHWRTITTRQGGDGENTLGYNLGAALGAMHFKAHLLKSGILDINRAPR